MIDEVAGGKTLDSFEPERITTALNDLTLTRQPSLADQVLHILLDRIKDGVYPPGDQLPPENELIEEFKISRATLRSAYAKMEERNLIQRRQGIGTFVSSQLNIANPLMEAIDFNDRISLQGFQPGFEQVSAKILIPDEEIADPLNMEPGAEALRIEKLWTADGQPIVYIINHLPLSIFENRFTQDELLRPGFTEPLFWFLRQKCNLPVDHLTSCITPAIVSDCQLPEKFSTYDKNTSLLVIEDVGFTAAGRPVFHSWEHLLGPAKKFETIRRIL
jgi:GntR family transcriptional regulator